MIADIETRLSRPYLPQGGGVTFAELTITPQQAAQNTSRQVALCIDRSGSMTGDPISGAREGAKWVVGLLEEQDYLSLVTFNSSSQVVMDAAQMTEANKERARDIIDDISAGGGTDISGGIRDARDTLAGLPTDDDIARRILLLSDGKDSGNFEALAEDVSDRGVSIEAAGLGDEYEEDVIRTLAEGSQGRWRHLDQPGDIRDFFNDTVTEASTVIAADPTLTLNVSEGVEIDSVYRARPQIQEVDVEWSANTAEVPVPDIAENQPQEVVLEFNAPEHDPREEVLLANAVLEAGGETQTEQVTVVYSETPDELGVHNEEVEVKREATILRNDMINAETDVEQEEVQTRIEEMEERYPDQDEAVTRLEEDGDTIMEEGRAGKDSVSTVYEDDEGQLGD
jgi:Ca-activated chloride channel family protein